MLHPRSGGNVDRLLYDMRSDTLPTETAEAFAERLVGVLNDATLALMISIGHRTALFDRMAERPASTSEQVAEAAGLQERYVREWLGAMVTGRIVDHDVDTATYALPAERAACLARAAAWTTWPCSCSTSLCSATSKTRS